MTAGRALTASLLLALAGLVACSADKPKPTVLENYAPKIVVPQVWNTSIGSIGYPMVATAREGVAYVASGDGSVRALRAETGAEVWRAEAGAAISAGVGSDGRYTSVVTPPLVAGERVFVMSVDRAVHAFDAVDGRRLWVLARPGDALTLSQASVLGVYKNTLLVAQSQRLVAVDPLRGTVQWEASMASPRGTNEVERLADLLGPMVRVGDRVCMRAFQSAVACADASRGAVLWSRNVGGVQAVGGDAERVFGADASDRITAWKADNGDVAWTNEKLLYRGLSGALVVGPSVVFGDSEGFVHFLSSATGEQQLRLPTDGKAVVGTPVLAGNTLLITTRGGGLYAFRPN